MKKALISGISGQDGFHLTDYLLNKGYQVHGLVRAAARPRTGQAPKSRGRLEGRVLLHKADLLDQTTLQRLFKMIEPDEIYNLASESFVPASWQEPVLTAELSGVAVTRLLDAMRQVCPRARFYQASSSEMFGKPQCSPQDEGTPFQPRTPYGTAKLYGHHITVNYRENYGLYAASGILFNHEGPRRGLEFVTRKISHTVARIKRGLASELRLGNLDARRDWGYAGDYVEAMWLMLQMERAEDFVIGSGETHSVEELVRLAFDHTGLDWKRFVVVDPLFCRPPETIQLVADNGKARRLLGWRPKVSFAELVAMMVDADLDLLHKETEERHVGRRRSAPGLSLAGMGGRG